MHMMFILLIAFIGLSACPCAYLPACRHFFIFSSLYAPVYLCLIVPVCLIICLIVSVYLCVCLFVHSIIVHLSTESEYIKEEETNKSL